MPTALFVSPHLDDVAFSCGGAVLMLGRAGWRTVVVTAFTASVPAPQGFALACQLDKGLGADVDYLAVRRREDEEYARRAAVARLCWLDLPEAPHRGYASAPALFGGYVAGDLVAGPLRDALRTCVDDEQPELVFAPQALGGHVDHRRVAEAVVAVAGHRAVQWYRDLPYGLRQPTAISPVPEVGGLGEAAVDITAVVDAKAHAAAAYTTQLGFQFGGADECSRALREHAWAEAGRLGRDGAAEVVRTAYPLGSSASSGRSISG